MIALAIMRITPKIRFSVALLLSLLAPLLLSGCFLEFIGLGKSAPSAEADKAQLAADDAIQEASGNPPEKPAGERKTPEPLQPADAQPPSPQSGPVNPEAIMPLNGANGPDSGPPPGALERREAGDRAAVFSYSNGTLTEDTVWHGEVLIEGGMTVAPQATLTVQSGTVVRFKKDGNGGPRGSLVIQGRIVVSGTSDRPVIFRSLYERAETGDWQGIVLLASSKRNLIENSRVEGAETGLDASFSTVTLKNTVFRKCRSGARFQDCVMVMTGGGAGECGTGMILYDSEADIRSAEFFGSRLGLYAARTSLSLGGAKLTGNNTLALSAEKCRLNINGSSFTTNGGGLGLTGCEGEVTGNRIARNAGYGLLLSQARVKVRANEIERNTKAGIRIEDGKAIAWGNVLSANGDYDLYNAGSEEFRAIGNWWGDEGTDVAARIYDRHVDESRGRVLYQPVLQKRPLLDIP